MGQILTPTGYRDISTCVVGDSVSAFDMVTGSPLVNTIEGKQWVDATEWARWWYGEPSPPAFKFYKINGSWTLNSEQSIWRNANNVCHARDLVPGDILFNDTDASTIIISIEEVSLAGWYRFDISGDHSYIVDGLTLHNASRFWVGGTATWDASNTTPWASSSNGAGGQSVPGSADTVTFDASSGGGTATVNTTVTVQTITMGAFTGTLDFSANNNNCTISGSAGVGFNISGTGTRTLNCGSGTFSFTQVSGNPWDITTATNLTLSAASCTLDFTIAGAQTSSRAMRTGAKTYGTVTIAQSGTQIGSFQINGLGTIATLNVSGNKLLGFSAGTTNITNAFNWNAAGSGSTSSMIVNSITVGSTATISTASGSPTMNWCALQDMTFSGGATFTATNSLDIAHNSGITITGPGGAFPVLGGPLT